MNNRERVHKLRELCKECAFILNRAEAFIQENKTPENDIQSFEVINMIHTWRNLMERDFTADVINPD